MTALAIFSHDEIELLASLPWKVGIWISHSDDLDGEADDEREVKALKACLRHFVKIQAKTLTGEIMQETLKREDKHEVWTDQSFNALPDVKKGLLLLQPKVTKDEFRDIRRALMEIASAVAEAFGEFGAFDEGDDENTLGKIIGKLTGLTFDDAGHPMNVSATEDSFLQKLRETLRGKA